MRTSSAQALQKQTNKQTHALGFAYHLKWQWLLALLVTIHRLNIVKYNKNNNRKNVDNNR